jgi:hypothetical protein
MTEPEDYVQLDPDLRTEYEYIRAHYARARLSHSNNIIWDMDLKVAEQFPEHEWDWNVFLFSGHHNDVRPNPKWHRTAAMWNSKNHFVRQCQALEAPVPETHLYDSVQAALADVSRFKYPVYFKEDVSASGAGVIRIEDQTRMRAYLAQRTQCDPFQIQAEIQNVAAFLNVQYMAKAGKALPLAVTEQVLKGNAHCGNRYPTRFNPFQVCKRAADTIAASGFLGVFAFDVAADHSGGFHKVECNPRVNGSTYTERVKRKLRARCWASNSYTVGCRTLADLELRDLEYNPRTRRGIILINWGTILVQKIGVMSIAPTHEECDTLLNTFESRFAVSH